MVGRIAAKFPSWVISLSTKKAEIWSSRA